MTTEYTVKRIYSIAVDFDGVIHSYTSPWASAEIIPDPPVPGAIRWLNEMSNHFTVIIFTTRGKTEAGRAAVREWLVGYGYAPLSIHSLSQIPVMAEKPPALIYLDDRAVRFDGKNFPTVDQIHREFVPWNKGTPPEKITVPIPKELLEKAIWRFQRDGYIDDQDEIYDLMHCLEEHVPRVTPSDKGL